MVYFFSVMSEQNSSPAKKKKTWYFQGFRDEWIDDHNFKEWLTKYSTGNAFCRCCQKQFKNTSKTKLMAHKDTANHKAALVSAKSASKMTTFFSKPKPKMDEKVAQAELLIAGFFAEHHVPYIHADHLIDVCKKAFADSDIAKKCTLKRTKVSYLVQDGIAYYEKQTIAQICQNQRFSIIIDESTDVSVCQVLAVVVRYFDHNRGDVCDALLDTIAVEDGTARGLYSALKNMFIQMNIPLTNIIGFGSDNCSTMMGIKSGFQALLKQDVPSVFVMGCVCHSFALCSSHAVKNLPSYLESFLKDVTAYFSRNKQQATERFCHDSRSRSIEHRENSKTRCNKMAVP